MPGISNNMNYILSRCMRDGDAETVSTALRSLRHFECSNERFEMISTELTNAKEFNLERYQVASFQMWECPSTEALNFAEGIYHNTAFDTCNDFVQFNFKYETLRVILLAARTQKYFDAGGLIFLSEEVDFFHR